MLGRLLGTCLLLSLSLAQRQAPGGQGQGAADVFATQVLDVRTQLRARHQPLSGVVAGTPPTGHGLESGSLATGLRAAVVLDEVEPAPLSFEQQVDRLDHFIEERHRPKTLPAWALTAATPFLGAALFLLAFPVLYWNERRAVGLRRHRGEPKPEQAGTSSLTATTSTGLGTGTGTASTTASSSPLASAGKGAGSPGGPEASGSTSPHRYQPLNQAYELAGHAYDERIGHFEDTCCACLPCTMVERTCYRVPEMQTHKDLVTYTFRLLGFTMMYVGLDMFLYPLYFALHLIWFFGFLVAGHLMFCACKASLLGTSATICISWTVHRPWTLVALALGFVACIGLTVYYQSNYLQEQHVVGVAAVSTYPVAAG